MTLFIPRVLDTTLTLPATAFNNAIADGTLGTLATPTAGHDPAAMFVNGQNITVKGTGTYIIFVTAAFQGTANYHTRVQIQVNSVTVADQPDQQNSLSAQNVIYYRTITFRGTLNNGDVVRVCGGFSTGSQGATGNMMLARQTI